MSEHYTKIPGYQKERDLGEYLHPVKSYNANFRSVGGTHNHPTGWNTESAEKGLHELYQHAIKMGHGQKQAMNAALALLGQVHDGEVRPVKYHGDMKSVPLADRPPEQDMPDDEPVLKESSVRSGFNRRGTTRRHPVDNRRKSY
jgi:hypothetical protein